MNEDVEATAGVSGRKLGATKKADANRVRSRLSKGSLLSLFMQSLHIDPKSLEPLDQDFRRRLPNHYRGNGVEEPTDVMRVSYGAWKHYARTYQG